MQQQEPAQDAPETADPARETPAGSDQTASDQTDVQPVEFTGQAAVDAVLASLESLDDLPMGDHVEVFDRAHQGLRRALDDAGRDAATDDA